MQLVLVLIHWLWAPVAALGISVVYFQHSRNVGISERLTVSAHGAALALLFAGASLIHVSGAAQPSFAIWFWCAFVVPGLLIAFALLRYQGRPSVHLYQIGNMVVGAWVWFVGTMAVTGNWL